MESTWESRDLPVLEAVVRFFEEEFDREHDFYPAAADIAERTGLEVEQVYQAAIRLSPTYVEIDDSKADELWELLFKGVTDAARRAVGQWPSPEVWVDRLVKALREAAERESDLEQKTRLRAMAEGLGGFARDVAVGVMSGGITQAMAL